MNSLTYLIFSLALSVGPLTTQAWAQEKPENSLELTQKMEKAKDLKEVISILRQVPKDLGLTERLMIYNQTPETIVNIKKVLEIVHSQIRIQPDAGYATELIFALELDSQINSQALKKIITRRDQVFVRNLFFDSMIEWRDGLAKETSVSESEIHGTTNVTSTAFTERSLNLVKALILGMSLEQQKALLTYEKSFAKRNKKDQKSAIKKFPHVYGSDSKLVANVKYATSVFGFPLLAASLSVLANQLGFSFSPVPGGDHLIATLVGALPSSFTGVYGHHKWKENKAKRAQELESAISYYQKRADMLTPFFGALASNVSACALSMSAQRQSAK